MGGVFRDAEAICSFALKGNRMTVTTKMRKEIGVERVLVDKPKLAARVAALAGAIDDWYPDSTPILVGVLNGASVFMTELMQEMSDPGNGRFHGRFELWHEHRIVRRCPDSEGPGTSIEGKDVLVVEDIVDSGLTLQYLLDVLARRNPRTIRVVALLRKVKHGDHRCSGRFGRFRDSGRICNRLWA